MADILADGVAWLANEFARCSSKRVLYQRGDDWCEFDATLGRSSVQVDDGDGNIRIARVDATLLFQADLLVLGSSEPVLPERGDRVTVYYGSLGVIHEVLPMGSDDAYQWGDHEHTRLRVNLKRVGVET